jgi:hypothetical protein
MNEKKQNGYYSEMKDVRGFGGEMIDHNLNAYLDKFTAENKGATLHSVIPIGDRLLVVWKL